MNARGNQLFMESNYCSECSLNFNSRNEYLSHIQVKHLRALIINTDKGNTVSFSRSSPGKFICPVCFSPCRNINEVLLHLFCKEEPETRINKKDLNCIIERDAPRESNEMAINVERPRIEGEPEHFDFLLTSGSNLNFELRNENSECATKFLKNSNLNEQNVVGKRIRTSNNENELEYNESKLLYRTILPKMESTLNMKMQKSSITVPMTNSSNLIQYSANRTILPKLKPILNAKDKKPLVDVPRTDDPNYKAFFTILAKYIHSEKSLKTVLGLFLDIREDNPIKYSKITYSIGPGNRPRKEQRSVLMDELVESGLIRVVEAMRNSKEMYPGPNFK